MYHDMEYHDMERGRGRRNICKRKRACSPVHSHMIVLNREVISLVCTRVEGRSKGGRRKGGGTGTPRRLRSLSQKSFPPSPGFSGANAVGEEEVKEGG